MDFLNTHKPLNEVGPAARSWREHRDMDASAIGQIVGLDAASYAAFEKGSLPLPEEKYPALLKALKCDSIEKLLGAHIYFLHSASPASPLPSMKEMRDAAAEIDIPVANPHDFTFTKYESFSPAEVGDAARRLMTINSWSSSGMHKRSGVSPADFSDFENGRLSPKSYRELLPVILSALQCDNVKDLMAKAPNITSFKNDREQKEIPLFENAEFLGPIARRWREYNNWPVERIAKRSGAERAYYDFEAGKNNLMTTLQIPDFIYALGCVSPNDLAARLVSIPQLITPLESIEEETRQPIKSLPPFENARVIGLFARKWREYNGWEVEDIAAKADVSLVRYYTFEQGINTGGLPASRFIDVANALECDSLNDLAAQVASLPDAVNHRQLCAAMRRARISSKISVASAASIVDMTEETYRLFEAGLKNIPGIKIDTLLKHMGINSRKKLLEGFVPTHYEFTDPVRPIPAADIQSTLSLNEPLRDKPSRSPSRDPIAFAIAKDQLRTAMHEYRKATGKSFQEIADAAGLNAHTVQAFYYGQTLSEEKLAKLLEQDFTVPQAEIAERNGSSSAQSPIGSVAPRSKRVYTRAPRQAQLPAGITPGNTEPTVTTVLGSWVQRTQSSSESTEPQTQDSDVNAIRKALRLYSQQTGKSWDEIAKPVNIIPLSLKVFVFGGPLSADRIERLCTHYALSSQTTGQDKAVNNNPLDIAATPDLDKPPASWRATEEERRLPPTATAHTQPITSNTIDKDAFRKALRSYKHNTGKTWPEILEGTDLVPGTVIGFVHGLTMSDKKITTLATGLGFQSAEDMIRKIGAPESASPSDSFVHASKVGDSAALKAR